MALSCWITSIFATEDPMRKPAQLQDPSALDRAYLDQLFENARVAMVMADTKGRVLRVNKRFLKLFGYATP